MTAAGKIQPVAIKAQVCQGLTPQVYFKSICK